MENKLIGMCEYILKNDNHNLPFVTRYSRVFEYAQFLKQNLTLGMFVPCDDEGNVLEEPKGYKTFLNTPFGTDEDVFCLQFQQAKERVIFEGFEIKERSCNKSCSPIDFCVGGKCDINGCYSKKEYEIITDNSQVNLNLLKENEELKSDLHREKNKNLFKDFQEDNFALSFYEWNLKNCSYAGKDIATQKRKYHFNKSSSLKSKYPYIYLISELIAIYRETL